MFDFIGSIIGAMVVFGFGVYIGRNHYEQFITYVKTLVTKIKGFFQRSKSKK